MQKYHDGLELLTPGEPVHDARPKDGRLVQIKTTQRDTGGVSCGTEVVAGPKDMNEDGSMEEACYGPGDKPWEMARKMTKTGQKHIRLKKLGE